VLTIYTTFRDFSTERINDIQRNAVQSWLELKPTPEIMVMGNEPGSQEICEEFGLRYIEVEVNEFGTPMLKDMMEKAEELASNEYIALVSGDIVLLQDVISSLNALKSMDMFLGVGIKKDNPRINGDLVHQNNWAEFAKSLLVSSVPTSGDFFMYRKGFLKAMPEMPPFAIGRCRCDSWLVYHAYKAGFLVNVTDSTTIIHQYHDHSHVKRFNGMSPELMNNRAFGDETIGARMDNANWKLTADHQLQENKNFYVTTMKI